MKTIKRTILLSMVLIFAAGCDSGFEDINRNPFAQTTADPALLFAGAQRTYVGNWETENTIIQHFVNPNNAGATLGPNFNADIDGFNNGNWTNSYPGTLKGMIEALNILGATTDRVNLMSMIRIWKAQVFMGLVDEYGDLPYFKAGRAYIDGSAAFYPSYDDDEEIYADIEKELRESIAAFDATKDYVSADLFYGKNGHSSTRTATATDQIAKWKKLGNSLLLRLGMRYSKVNPTKAAALVSEAFNGGVISSNSDNAFNTYDGTLFTNVANNGLVNNNPHFYYAAEPFVNQMKSTSDPRSKFMIASFANPGNPLADPAPNTAFASQFGVPVGVLNVNLSRGTKGTGYDYSQVNVKCVASLTAPTFYVTYAQTSLLLAEAKFKGWITGGLTAKQYYENGVKAHMDMFILYPNGAAISGTDQDTYLADGAVSYDIADVDPVPASREAKILNLINTQYWIANITNGAEAWINFKRTGKPALSPNLFNTNLNGGFIRRLSYPDEELSRNGDNYFSASAAIGGDNLLSRVFWDIP